VISFAATAKPSSGAAEASVERKAESRRSTTDEEDEGGKYFASLLVGSGVGYTSGNGEVNADTPVSGPCRARCSARRARGRLLAVART
jgi:hypothetical protein